MNAGVCVIPLLLIGALAVDGRVWRAFDHLIVQFGGGVVLVPVGLVEGDLTGVIDRCPVPWEEVWTVLDVPPGCVRQVSERTMYERYAGLVKLGGAVGWVWEDLSPAGRVPTIRRLMAPNGVRFARLVVGG